MKLTSGCLHNRDVKHGRNGTYLHRSTFHVSKGFVDKILGKFIFLRSFDEPKKSKKSEPKLAFGHVIADYIVRNYTMVVIPRNCSNGETSFGTPGKHV